MTASGKQHRRHRSRAEADQLAAEYEASGLSQAEFCQERDVALKTLARYLARFRKQSARAVLLHHAGWSEAIGGGSAGLGAVD